MKPPAVIQAVTEALSGMGNAGRGAGTSSLGASRTLYETREELAALFGAVSPSCIAFAANSTEALNTAIRGLICDGDHVITSVMEHNSVLRPLYQLEKERNIRLTILPADRSGRIRLLHSAAADNESNGNKRDVQFGNAADKRDGEQEQIPSLEEVITSETKAVVLTHASNLTGNLNDLSIIGKICREKGVYLIVDASQSAGVFPINIEEMHISALCFTGHKSLFGPQGTGGIALGSDLMTPDGKCLLAPLKVGGSGIHTFDREHPKEMPTALEAGTQNAHGISGLLAGVRFIRETGQEIIREKEDRLARRFYEGVKDLPGITLYGDFSCWENPADPAEGDSADGSAYTGRTSGHSQGRPLLMRGPVVSLNIGDFDSARVGDALYTEYGIETRSGGHCAPLMHRHFGTVEQGMVRFSFSYYNTEEEVDAAVRAVTELCL